MIHAREDYSRIQDPKGLIGKDEPVFLIRATDSAAPEAVEAWAKIAERKGASPKIIIAARKHADAMRVWQKANGDKVHNADLPDDKKTAKAKRGK